MKAQVLVDMDGVLADVYTHFINMEYKESGIQLNRNELCGKKKKKHFLPLTNMYEVKAFSYRSHYSRQRRRIEVPQQQI